MTPWQKWLLLALLLGLMIFVPVCMVTGETKSPDPGRPFVLYRALTPSAPTPTPRPDSGQPFVLYRAPTPTPPTALVPTRTWPETDVSAAIRRAFPDDTEEVAIAVAWCESTNGQDPDAYSWQNPNKGLFQIWQGHLGHSLPAHMDLLDDYQNIEAARILSAGGSDWSIWPWCP